MAYTTIDKSDEYFNTVLYTGTGSGGSNRQITGVGFQPDWVWVKTRDSAQEHVLSDVVRGATGSLDSSATTEEEITNTRIGAFISDGFQLGSGSVQNRVNQSGIGIASWNWLASNTTASNTDGSITSTVSANTTSGFSIVSYTGNATASATVGHGLSSAPQMVITKNRVDAGTQWQVLTNIYPSYSEGDFIYLNATDAKANSANVSFLPTSTTWQMKSGQAGNVAVAQIAYCFHSVKGFSKFGSYTGNGNADGTFVYTGFKPAFVLVKQSSAAGEEWQLVDNKRNTFNPSNTALFPSATTVENSGNNRFDFLSNGFKCRSTGAGQNASGATYIYMAFAENPFVTSTSIPTTAR
jgi:hypothetical protein